MLLLVIGVVGIVVIVIVAVVVAVVTVHVISSASIFGLALALSHTLALALATVSVSTSVSRVYVYVFTDVYVLMVVGTTILGVTFVMERRVVSLVLILSIGVLCIRRLEGKKGLQKRKFAHGVRIPFSFSYRREALVNIYKKCAILLNGKSKKNGIKQS